MADFLKSILLSSFIVLSAGAALAQLAPGGAMDLDLPGDDGMTLEDDPTFDDNWMGDSAAPESHAPQPSGGEATVPNSSPVEPAVSQPVTPEPVAPPSETQHDTPAPDQRPLSGDDYVVAKVNGMDIRYSDLEAIRVNNRQTRDVPMDQIFDRLLDIAVGSALLDKEARAKKMQKDPEVQARLKKLEANLMRRAYLKHRAEELITEDMLKAEYEKFLQENPPIEEVQLRQIVVKTRDQAKEVISALNRGQDFAELAAAQSTGLGAQSGGNLGYIARHELPEELADRAFAMPEGTISPPVRTGQGWHVIKVEGQRVRPAATFEEVKPSLHDNLAQDIAEQVIAELHGSAKVVRYGPDGKPLH